MGARQGQQVIYSINVTSINFHHSKTISQTLSDQSGIEREGARTRKIEMELGNYLD